MNTAAQYLSRLNKSRMSDIDRVGLDDGDGPGDVVVVGLAECHGPIEFEVFFFL